MPNPRLTANIERLAAYTIQYPELKAAHHFLYDVRRPSQAKPCFVVMGVNPGETVADWKSAPEPTEETSRYDFHIDTGWGRSACRWAKECGFFLEGAPYVLAEIFAWSSRDSRQFGERFGPLAQSPHLRLCVEVNRDLIEAYRPKAVVVAGIGMSGLCEKLFDLTHKETVPAPKGRLIERFTDGRRPWIFTRHWTASFGFSKAMRDQTKAYILAQSGA